VGPPGFGLVVLIHGGGVRVGRGGRGRAGGETSVVHFRRTGPGAAGRWIGWVVRRSAVVEIELLLPGPSPAHDGLGLTFCGGQIPPKRDSVYPAKIKFHHSRRENQETGHYELKIFEISKGRNSITKCRKEYRGTNLAPTTHPPLTPLEPKLHHQNRGRNEPPKP
jgi:hypothetical protein